MPKIKKRNGAAKEPEQEILTVAHKVSGLMAAYRNQVTIAVAAVAIALVVLAGYSFIRSSQEQKAAPLVAVAHEYYSPAGAMNADYAKALELFRDVQKKYPGTKSGAIAQYYVGNCLINMGRPDEALKEYQAFVNRYPDEKFLLGLVYQRMGYASLMLGKQAEAVKAFELSEKVSGPGVATVELARLYEASGNIPESQKKYKLIMEKLAGTSWGIEAMGKVQMIAPAAQPAAGKTGK